MDRRHCVPPPPEALTQTPGYLVAELMKLFRRTMAEQFPGERLRGQHVLEEAGYVERRRDPEDRRRYALDVTEAGRLYLGRRREMGRHLNEHVFAPLAPHEREQFREMIVRVLAHHDPRFAGLAPSAGTRGTDAQASSVAGPAEAQAAEITQQAALDAAEQAAWEISRRAERFDPARE
jgi:hypothetical protein